MLPHDLGPGLSDEPGLRQLRPLHRGAAPRHPEPGGAGLGHALAMRSVFDVDMGQAGFEDYLPAWGSPWSTSMIGGRRPSSTSPFEKSRFDYLATMLPSSILTETSFFFSRFN